MNASHLTTTHSAYCIKQCHDAMKTIDQEIVTLSQCDCYYYCIQSTVLNVVMKAKLTLTTIYLAWNRYLTELAVSLMKKRKNSKKFERDSE